MASQDQFEAPDYYLLDELLTSEHLLIRKTIRSFVKKEISPIIEEACQSCIFPKQILPKKIHGGRRYFFRWYCFPIRPGR